MAGYLKRLGAAVAAVGLLTGCATTPTHPTVMALAGSGKTFDQFHADDLTCRQFAARDLGSSTSQAQYDVAYLQCMYAKGHQIPVPGGRPGYTSTPGGSPPTAPPATPPAPSR